MNVEHAKKVGKKMIKKAEAKHMKQDKKMMGNEVLKKNKSDKY